MAASMPDRIAALAGRVADDTTRIRECLRTHRWDEALAAAHDRQAGLEALWAARGAGTTQPVRELLQAALQETRALAPDIARRRALAAAQLRQCGQRTRASAEYRRLPPR